MSNINNFGSDDYYKLPTVEDCYNYAHYHGDPKDPVTSRHGLYRSPRPKAIPATKQELFTGDKLNEKALEDWCADIGVTKDNYRGKPSVGLPVPVKIKSADQDKMAADLKTRDEQQKYYDKQRSQGAISKNYRAVDQGHREMQCAVRMPFDKLEECRENEVLDDQECNPGWPGVEKSPRRPKKAGDPGTCPSHHDLLSDSDIELATMEKWCDVLRQGGTKDGEGVVNGIAEIPGRLPGSPRAHARLPVFGKLTEKKVDPNWPPPDRWAWQDDRPEPMPTKDNPHCSKQEKNF